MGREAHGLAVVMRDEHHGGSGALPRALDLLLKQLSRVGIEGGKGLVHEHHLGLHDERAGDGCARSHATRELVWL